MTIRAKFYVSDVTPANNATAAVVSLGAVCRGVENSLWSQATPCGSISMTIKNDAAVEQFEKYAEYEVTFTKVAKPMPGDGHPPVRVADMHGRYVCETCGLTLGYTDSAMEKQPHLAQYSTEEKLTEYRRQHDATFGVSE